MYARKAELTFERKLKSLKLILDYKTPIWKNQGTDTN